MGHKTSWCPSKRPRSCLRRPHGRGRFFPLLGADHLVTDRRHAETAARFLHLWLGS